MSSDFLKYQAQTSPHPLGLCVSRAEGSYIYDDKGTAYLDFVAGVSACPLGHCHPVVVKAIQHQAETYLHVMVYGEFIQDPSLDFTRLLAQQLPYPLETTYLVNSATEAMEGALKLAKIITGRFEIIAAYNSYHGNTQGSMSIMGYEARKHPFRPLIPGTRFIDYNSEEDIRKITDKTAAVVLEIIQGGAGFILPQNDFLKKVRKRCYETGTLLILDEVQTGFGRTKTLFAFEQYKITPDILVIGKAMAGGMPAGAFVSSHDYMARLKDSPKLGHITTFGGHPVIAAAALATLKELLCSNIISEVGRKEILFRELLIHPKIKSINGKGLMLAIILKDSYHADELIIRAKEQKLILFWLLFEPCAVRISPPLTISESEIRAGCEIIIRILEDLQ